MAAGPDPSETQRLVLNNIDAADTTNTDQIRPGEALGLNLTGNGYTVGIWEPTEPGSNSSYVRDTHDELNGRVVFGDSPGPSSFSDHATHVAGTIGASGVDANAIGMATQVQIRSYSAGLAGTEFAEMDADASLIVASNHSYGSEEGWYVEDTPFRGLITPSGRVDVWDIDFSSFPNEDLDFGRYDSNAADLDQVLQDNPNLLSVWAAGNHRDDGFTNVSTTNEYVTRFTEDPGGIGWTEPGWYLVPNSGATAAPGSDGNNGTGYDSLSPYKVAKNSLVVGAVFDVTSDPYNSSDIDMSPFSSWGPTDDGRIKPDVVANGTGLYSSVGTADDAYDWKAGTSMAAPNVTGTAVLLIEHYENLFGVRPASATTKGLLIHTASDAGNPGPDYSFGWGLVNAAAAANFLTGASGSTTDNLYEQTYAGSELTFDFDTNGSSPLTATIAWTDPPGTPPGYTLDDPQSVLKNDLDLWITGPGGVFYPWTLDPATPEDNAVRTSVNHRDNVEQVLIDSTSPGTYTVHVGDTGNVVTQDFSLLVSGGVSQAPASFDITASLVASGSLIASSFLDETAPRRLYTFDGQKGDLLTITTDGGTLTDWLDPALAIFSPTQTPTFINSASETDLFTRYSWETNRPLWPNSADPAPVPLVLTEDGTYTIQIQVDPAATGGETVGPYDLTFDLDRRGPDWQTFWLDFSGFELSDVTSYFGYLSGDPAVLQQTILSSALSRFEEIYSGYEIVASLSPYGSLYSTIEFLDDTSQSDTTLGIADQIDYGNRDRQDDASVFFDHFGYGGTQFDSAEEVGIALGTVAAHEAGHLMGLGHVDALQPFGDVMGQLWSLYTLLSTANFGNYDLYKDPASLLGFDIDNGFDVFGKQNAPAVLQATVGLERVPGKFVERFPTLLSGEGLDGSGDQYGWSVDVDGNWAVVGAYYDDQEAGNAGAAYVLEKTAGGWVQRTKIIADDAQASDYFGYSVAISGNTIVVGAHYEDERGGDAGAAYIFTGSGSVWTQQQKMTASDGAAGDRFGASVDIDGDTVVVGAQFDDSYTGSAYVFTRTASVWSQDQKLLAADGAVADYFGYSVGIDGDTVVVGAYYDDDKGGNSGSAYVFTRTGSVWSQEQKLLAADGVASDRFGISVGIDADTVVVGAYYDDDKEGSAYIFERTDFGWVQQDKLTASDGAASDYFGYSVDIVADTVVVGAYWDDDKGAASGSAYVFERAAGDVWLEQEKLVAAAGGA
ncbi:MAG: S8 family serine peptidase, partial [Pirellulales bacterium]